VAGRARLSIHDVDLSQGTEMLSADLKLDRLPPLSPLPGAALPSVSRFPRAPFADCRRLFTDLKLSRYPPALPSISEIPFLGSWFPDLSE